MVEACAAAGAPTTTAMPMARAVTIERRERCMETFGGWRAVVRGPASLPDVYCRAAELAPHVAATTGASAASAVGVVIASAAAAVVRARTTTVTSSSPRTT